jgi:hypothetical protein
MIKIKSGRGPQLGSWHQDSQALCIFDYDFDLLDKQQTS